MKTIPVGGLGALCDGGGGGEDTGGVGILLPLDVWELRIFEAGTSS